MKTRHWGYLVWLCMAVALPASETVVTPLRTEMLAGMKTLPVPLQKIMEQAAALTSRNLGYLYGSADPAGGGMDCSGTVSYTLQAAGVSGVPRSSDAMYAWLEKAQCLTPVSGTPEITDPVFARLRPGDLLFWSGTYDPGARQNKVTHVMIYLGLSTEGKPLMFGASDGRPYAGRRMCGVSLFDFRMPAAEGRARFVGYGPVPGVDVSGVSPVPPGSGKKLP